MPKIMYNFIILNVVHVLYKMDQGSPLSFSSLLMGQLARYNSIPICLLVCVCVCMRACLSSVQDKQSMPTTYITI